MGSIGSIARVFGIPGLVLLAVIGIRKNEGIWGNVISAINVSFAALIAINYWEPLAALAADQVKGGMFYWDYVCLWAIFLVSYGLLDDITHRISRVKVKFPETVEKVGGPVSGVFLFVTFILFYTFSLHLAPLGTPYENSGEYAQYDLIKAQSYDLLSSGNLAPFVGESTFNSNRVFQDQNARRAALKAQAKEKHTFVFEGEIPPRKP
ncbi:MAG: hypothetical protein LBU65_00380 [Planctomycetaceae bacterium]|jgi:hypothetical protein|nr:hypothetical protein [Planctomycetaceae bacterium]